MRRVCCIPMFKAVDLCYNILYGDLDKGQKLVFINELLACIQRDEDGNPYLTPQQKEIFILLGMDGEGKLPEEKTLVQEYNPEIRVEQITKAFELVLSLLSMQFGYGSKKYTFENDLKAPGAVKTGEVELLAAAVLKNSKMCRTSTTHSWKRKRLPLTMPIKHIRRRACRQVSTWKPSRVLQHH